MSRASDPPSAVVPWSAVLYCGLVIALALVLGGGTAKGLWSAFVIQLAVLPLILVTDFQAAIRHLGRLGTAVLVGTILIFALQLLPLGLVDHPSVPEAGSLTLGMGRTLDSLAFMLAAFTMLVFATGLSENDHNRLLRFFFLGLVVNMAVALVQFAATRQVVIGLLPYEPVAGFFANPNHFSSLLFVAIPFVVYQAVSMQRAWVAVPVVAFVIFIQFAAGSVAGIFIALGCTLLSFAVLAPMKGVARAVLGAAVLLGSAVLLLNPGNVLGLRPDSALDRPAIFATAFEAALASLPWGSGFGTFTLAYPRVQSADEFFSEVVNHAHNDFLELFIEGGIPALLLMLAYVTLLAWRVLLRPCLPIQRAAALAVLFVLVHTLVDYPLRTMGLAMVFAWLNAIILSRMDAMVPTVAIMADGDAAQQPRQGDERVRALVRVN
ncbi:O-antigen ligase like membrane protein [Devosia enhydra]|uniref:O-antigen ligase like membrane protein n=1 Tax=Devosia enhydra TaxID=665118 RepID=A0A1K2HTM4_9HYPH|nr:O-antigen ligase family protein [Devosia enhydra]SFZ80658.1 O-antigen ligase like membrane protein [Devosia enhydra]